MSLADYYSGGGTGNVNLPEGWSDVVVTEIRNFTYNSGNPGVEVWVQDEAGRRGKLSFVIVQTALWKLSNFASVCGIDKEGQRAYDPFSPLQHERFLISRRLRVFVEKGKPDDKGKQYLEVADWDNSLSDAPATQSHSVASTVPIAAQAPSPAPAAPPPARAPEPTTKDCPF